MQAITAKKFIKFSHIREGDRLQQITYSAEECLLHYKTPLVPIHKDETNFEKGKNHISEFVIKGIKIKAVKMELTKVGMR